MALQRTEMCGMDRFEFPQEGEAAASFCPTLQLPFPIAVRLDKLSEVAKVNTDAMRLAQEEISEYRRQLQAKTTELEALKGTQESLERQRQESEERHHADVLSYQVAVVQWAAAQAGEGLSSCWGGAALEFWLQGWEGVVANAQGCVRTGLPQPTGIRNGVWAHVSLSSPGSAPCLALSYL